MKDKYLKYIGAAILSAVSFCGCMEEIMEGDGDMRIEIGARVSSSVIAGKAGASGEIDYDTPESLHINLIRWDEGNNVTAGREELSAVMGLPAQDGTWRRNITFARQQYYLNSTDSVGFAGWYPDASLEEGAGWQKEGDNVIHSDNTMRYTIDGKTDVMVSDFVKGNFDSKIPPLKFRHALCMYNIFVYAVDGDTKDEWGHLTQLTILNLPDELIVRLPADVRKSDQVKFEFSPEPTDGQYKEYPFLADGDSKPLFAGVPNTGDDCYVGTVLGGAPAIGVLGIKATTVNEESGNSVSIARNFKPGYSYNIFLRFSSKGIINAEVTVADWVYDRNDYIVEEDFDLLTNLSRYGTANCYVVSSGNRGYCFDATVKGNGVNSLTRRDGSVIQFPDKSVDINGVASVKILRSDVMMKFADGEWKMLGLEDGDKRRNTPMIELLSDKLSDGKVLFRTVGNSGADGQPDRDDPALIYKGNVKIGALDANGNIIWTWHIWITDKPKNQGYLNGYIAQDRNLGSVSTDYSIFERKHSHWSGFYYQFGRKDPIYRPTVDESLEEYGWTINKQDSPVSVSEAHRNPITYYWDPNGNNWTTDENSDAYWGFISVRDDVVKTMYDPCPPGYRVPDTGIFETSAEGFTIEEKNNTAGQKAGYLFNIGEMIDIYYPNTICIVDGRIHESDKVGVGAEDNLLCLGVATPYDPTLYDVDAGDARYKNISWHFRYTGEALTNNANAIVSDPDTYHTKRSAAFPVRCILENSQPVVTDLSEQQTANSYVVSSTGFYKFRVDTRGNGVSGLNIYSSGTSVYRSFDAGMGATISNVDRVDVLWWQGDLSAGSGYMTFAEEEHTPAEIAAECPVTILDNGKVVDGEIMMMVSTTESKNANVGIAAYDSNDNIIWTWHIWIQPGINVLHLGDYTVMDRNLGATYAPDGVEDFNPDNLYANLGFYYQWGRKDPFFPPASLTQGSIATAPWYHKDKDGGWKKVTSRTIANRNTIPESVKNPLVFYSNVSSPGLWQTTYDGASGTSPANDLWGYTGSAGTIGNAFAKTMYDPCPPGYRVMQHDVFESANICSANADTKYTLQDYSNNDGNRAYGIYFQNNMQTGFNGNTVIADGIWFPNSYSISSRGVFDTAKAAGRLSTATPYSNGTSSLNSREMRWAKNNNSYVISQDNTGNWMADAKAVRCQME